MVAWPVAQSVDAEDTVFGRRAERAGLQRHALEVVEALLQPAQLVARTVDLDLQLITLCPELAHEL
eukprot:9471100-Pyramimonas_sp.AAC.1